LQHLEAELIKLQTELRDNKRTANASGAKTREQAIREIACDLKIRCK
jgi:hypothetical protein